MKMKNKYEGIPEIIHRRTLKGDEEVQYFREDVVDSQLQTIEALNKRIQGLTKKYGIDGRTTGLSEETNFTRETVCVVPPETTK